MFLLSQCFASKVCVASLKEFPFHIQSAWHVLCWGVGSRGRCLTLVPCQEGTALPRALWGLHCGQAGVWASRGRFCLCCPGTRCPRGTFPAAW